jgi:hypothetical protein
MVGAARSAASIRTASSSVDWCGHGERDSGESQRLYRALHQLRSGGSIGYVNVTVPEILDHEVVAIDL